MFLGVCRGSGDFLKSVPAQCPAYHGISSNVSRCAPSWKVSRTVIGSSSIYR